MVAASADEAHILNMCSMFGLTTWRKTLAYQTTKFGLVGFTAGLRADYCRDHFGVTALCPGLVPTNFQKRSNPGTEPRLSGFRGMSAETCAASSSLIPTSPGARTA